MQLALENNFCAFQVDLSFIVRECQYFLILLLQVKSSEEFQHHLTCNLREIAWNFPHRVLVFHVVYCHNGFPPKISHSALNLPSKARVV